MSAPPDYYRILHVQPDAPAAIIHASYRTLLQRAVGNSDETALLDLAYATLGDPQRRTAYDRDRVAAGGDGPQHDPVDPAGAPGTRNCLFCGTPHGLQRVIDRDDECGHCSSPLFAAERHRLEYSGQRMLNRIPKRHAIDVWVTLAASGADSRLEMRDLSLNGMQFVRPFAAAESGRAHRLQRAARARRASRTASDEHGRRRFARHRRRVPDAALPARSRQLRLRRGLNATRGVRRPVTASRK